jgi:hypothetical protein
MDDVCLYAYIPADYCPAVQVVLKKDKEKAHQQYKEGDLNDKVQQYFIFKKKFSMGNVWCYNPFLYIRGFSCPTRCI